MDLPGAEKNLLPLLINLMSETAPWFVGLLAICALAAMQSTGAAYLSTTAAIITRDILKPHLLPSSNDNSQKFFARVFALMIILFALITASSSTDKLVLIGGLAVAFGLQMWPALIAICYIPWFTRSGITYGLVAGLIVVLLTDRTNGVVADLIGFDLPFGRNPFTIHAAAWGLFANLTLTIVISFFTQCRNSLEHRLSYHKFFDDYAPLSFSQRPLVPYAWVIVLIWFFFAIGPGAVIGNDLFGDPGRPTDWLFGVPSLWLWQVIWWLFGVFMMWFLAYRLGLSTVPQQKFEALVEDFSDDHR